MSLSVRRAVSRSVTGNEEERAMETNESREALAMIAEERRRQIEDESWSPQLDDSYTEEQLARAASAYATPADFRLMYQVGEMKRPIPRVWPWADEWWKP